MVKVYLRGPYQTDREIDTPKVPSIGETFNLMDGAGPELDCKYKVANVEYVIHRRACVGSRLEKIIVHLKR